MTSDLKIEFRDTMGVKLLDAIIKQCPEPISICDKNGICIMANKAYHSIVGAKEGEIEGKHLRDLENNGIITPSAGLLAINKNLTLGYLLQYLPRVGKEVLITGFSIQNSSGDTEFFVSTARDIDELNSIRNKLKNVNLTGIGVYHGLDELNDLTLKLRQNKTISNIYCISGGRIKSPHTINNELIFESNIMKQLLQKIERVAKADVPVLITGETGTGKEIIASMIHNKSLRSNRPYITINCASVPENLVEAELFGYSDGAFTGAVKQGKLGLFEMAHTGTFLFEEIAELPLNIQAKLLRILEDMEIRQLGSTKSKKVDVRILAATNKNLLAEVQAGRFREDLYYRLSVVPVELPSLRQRKDEIVPLVNLFLNHANKKYNFNKQISLPAYYALEGYHWPGNIRELKNLINNLVICTENDLIDVGDLPSIFVHCFIDKTDATRETFNLRYVIADIEKQYLTNALKKHGSTRKAAQSLGLSQTTFLRKMNSYKLEITGT